MQAQGLGSIQGSGSAGSTTERGIYHFNSGSQELEKWAWPCLHDSQSTPVPPDELESHAREYVFRTPCCPCAYLTGSFYTPTKISLLEAVNENRTDAIRRPFIVVLERFYGNEVIPHRTYPERTTPSLWEIMAMDPDSYPLKDPQRDGFRRVLSPPKIEHGFSRGTNRLKRLREEEEESPMEALSQLMEEGLAEEVFWDSFVQCAKCSHVFPTSLYPYAHRLNEPQDCVTALACIEVCRDLGGDHPACDPRITQVRPSPSSSPPLSSVIAPVLGVFGSSLGTWSSWLPERRLVPLTLNPQPDPAAPQHMSEWRECFSHLLMLLRILEKLRRSHSFQLVNIWAELPAKAVKPPGYPVEGLVARMTRTWGDVMKGKGDNRCQLAPQEILDLPVNPRDDTLGSLDWRLREVTGNGRSLIVIFNKAILKQRGYKVALALQFGSFVIAFLSQDLIFQVKWLSLETPDSIDSPLIMNHPALVTVDVFENFGDFLGALVAWIKGRRRSQALRTSLASEVIRNEEGARKVWVGVGVYTVCEIFFLAGISMFLNEKEVFDNASRTARLANAFWQFAYKAQDLFMQVFISDFILRPDSTCISPSLVDNVLAPTQEQRELYVKYLFVFKKEITRLPTRMAQAVDNYHARLTILEALIKWRRDDRKAAKLLDFYEPSLTENALLLRTCHKGVDVRTAHRVQSSEHHGCRRNPCDLAKKVYTLGALSMGEEQWRKTAPPEVLQHEKEVGLDVLTKFCDSERCAGMISYEDRYHTFLPEFPGGIAPKDKPSNMLPRRKPIPYRVGTDSVYSIVPDFPENSSPDAPHMEKGISRSGARAVVVDPYTAHRMAFNSITKTDGLVAIGPLEYCGNGEPLTHAGKTHVSLVKDGDPRLPSHLLARSAMRRMATQTIRHIEQVRVKKQKQAVKMRAALARGKQPKAQTVSISVSKERVKARARVKKQLDSKVLVLKRQKQNFWKIMGKYGYFKNSKRWKVKTTLSEASLIAAIPDIPSRSSSLAPEDEYDFDFSSPPNTPPPSSPQALEGPLFQAQPSGQTSSSQAMSSQPEASPRKKKKRRYHSDRVMSGEKARDMKMKGQGG
ncbi:hypothetical protein FA13DRAFT_1721077 [Coprinellus micaceus]|uniref:Uncharacterized protein n=1 Tax=Coprinellus micaceus TaxID=71717 RepID=A0A4Y7S373_COPMI|nr:hypothetical protein FA13DRAFT_1721077 [Coprinellus micaceus]